MHKRSLAISTGWNWIVLPRCTHSRAPLIVRPRPGMRGASIKKPARKQEEVAVAVEVPGPSDDEQGEHVAHHPDGHPGRLLALARGGSQRTMIT